MHVSRSKCDNVLGGDNFLALGYESCICGFSFSLNLRKLNCIHNTRKGFFVQALVSSLHIQAAELPARRTADWNPPYTNKWDHSSMWTYQEPISFN